MSIEYRTLQTDEEDAVLDLWHEVFDVPRAYFARYFEADTARKLEDTMVAVANDGQLVSAVHVCRRFVRDENGTPHLAGCLANVATRPEFQKQGHSGRLLEMMVAHMQSIGCAWSPLGTGVFHHYARYGWQPVPTPFRRGSVVDTLPTPPDGMTVRPLIFADDWPAMAKIYDADNARRPLSVVRDDRYWPGFGARLFVEPNAVIWGAFDGEILVGYALTRPHEQQVGLYEICVTHRDAVLPLVIAAASGKQTLRAHLPSTLAIDEALGKVLVTVETGADNGVMLRSLSPDFPDDRLRALAARPDARFWHADDF